MRSWIETSWRLPPLLLPLLLLLLLCCTSCSLQRAPPSAKVPPEAWLSTAKLIEHWGYPGETHSVHTDDGFILDVHRISGRRGQFNRPAAGRTPVLLAHGFGATSECMVLRGNNTLAFMLADADFDVWLGNTRGNVYGRRHVSLSPADKKYWDFSWHENGVLDMRSTIDYILARTGAPSLALVGHSMGGTSLLALLSERPEFNAKVRAAFLLAPAAYFSTVRGAFLQARTRLPWSGRSLRQLSMENPFTRAPFPPLCLPDNGMTVNPNCIRIFASAQGPFHTPTNNAYLPVLLRHWPGGTSMGQLTHFLQLILRGDGFYKYDYGPERNRLLYGSAAPPPYNLTNVRCPTFFFYCDNDYQAHYKDIKRLAADVPGTAGLMRTPSKIFNHLDIMYEEAAADLVYKRLIAHMTKYRN